MRIGTGQGAEERSVRGHTAGDSALRQSQMWPVSFAIPYDYVQLHKQKPKITVANTRQECLFCHVNKHGRWSSQLTWNPSRLLATRNAAI